MSEKTKIICTSCPRGCNITIEHQGKTIENITGYTCKRGLAYAKDEFTLPKRVVTSTVRVNNGELAMLPVRTAEAIPKDKIFDCVKMICNLSVDAPIEIGDVVCSNICGTKVDLIAGRDINIKQR